MKAARPELSVWVITGDGDGLSIGGNHLIHTLRRNLDLQILLFNNRVYGLTKGQYSPTSREGMRSKSSPQGSIDHPLDPLALALGAGATFVARTIDVDAPHLQSVLHRAHAHKGTALVEILQNCPVYNDHEWGEVLDRKTRGAASLALVDGGPLVYGTKGARRGIHIEHGVPSIIELGDEEDPVAAGVTVHDERYESPSYAFALASLGRPDFPVPIGVLRAVSKPCYEDSLTAQVDEARAKHGPGDLEALLHSGDTWEVSA
jgi:2-oxoglutarate ferredoxin oxidoreductase subunit beta